MTLQKRETPKISKVFFSRVNDRNFWSADVLTFSEPAFIQKPCFKENRISADAFVIGKQISLFIVQFGIFFHINDIWFCLRGHIEENILPNSKLRNKPDQKFIEELIFSAYEDGIGKVIDKRS